MSGINKQSKICPQCGEIFYKPKNYSNRQWLKRRFCSRKCGAIKKYLDEKEICFFYEKLKMSSEEIAAKIEISGTHVRRILKKNGVKIREASVGKKLALNREHTKEKMRASATGRKLKESSKNKLREMVGPKNANWKGGITLSAGGYLCFTNSSENGVHANYPLHRIIAEWKLGRPIRQCEHVHHVDGDKLNNNPNNLVVITASEHAILHTEDRENGKQKKI